MTPSNPAVAAQDAHALAALIREQSAAEIAQLRADAQQRVERTRAAAAAEVATIRTAASRAGEERGRRRAAALLAAAETQSRLTVLRAREGHIVDILSRARTQLAALTGIENSAAVLAAFIREALSALPPGPVRIRMPEPQAALLDEAARRLLGAGRWALRFESGPVPGGGIIAESEDGRLRFDNSIDARCRRREVQLRLLAVDLLRRAAEGQSPLR